MYDKRGAMRRENIGGESICPKGSLDIGRNLFCVPWCWMDEPVDSPICPGVSPFLWIFPFELPHKSDCPQICINVQPFIEIEQYPIIKGLKTHRTQEYKYPHIPGQTQGISAKLFCKHSQVAFMPYWVVLKDERRTSNVQSRKGVKKQTSIWIKSFWDSAAWASPWFG